MVDLSFYAICFVYAGSITWVLYALRHQPLYDPRVLFTLSASLWLLILHGYAVGFEGYLAAKPMFYSRDLNVLSVMAIGLWLLGYLAFVGGATLGTRLPVRAVRVGSIGRRLLFWMSAALILLTLLNFALNVLLISSGNILRYLGDISLRAYQIEDGQGVSAAGYILGVVGVQLTAYLVGRKPPSRFWIIVFAIALSLVLIARFSQGRIFQTLVFMGACYVSYSVGAAHRSGVCVSWYRHVHYLIAAGFVGVSIYLFRMVSALQSLGISVNSTTVNAFASNFSHFALERGNVPNFPVVFTIIDKIPAEQGFLYGGTLFNWALTLVPSSLLEQDYLISLWIKETWYLDTDGGGLPPTAVGEWYANFGIAGVVIGMFVVGTLLGWLFKLTRAADSPFLAVLWGNLVFGFVAIYPKTDLAQLPIITALVVFSVWLLANLMQLSAGNGRG